MNAQCYRVIFNKARGMLMVVSESARSQGKTSNPTEGGSAISQVAGGSQTSTQVSAWSSYQGGKLMTLRSHLLLALGLATIVATSAHADSTNIVADRNAAANQQAVIINTSSGKTQVNIQTPSAGGVSRGHHGRWARHAALPCQSAAGCHRSPCARTAGRVAVCRQGHGRDQPCTQLHR